MRPLHLFGLVTMSVAIACNALSGASDLDTSEAVNASSTSSTSSGGNASSSSSTSSSSTSSGGASTSSTTSSSSSSTTSSGGSSSGDSGGPDTCNKPEPGLVAYYPLDETEGTVVHDCSGNGLDGQVVSGTGVWEKPGKFGRSFTTQDDAGCINLGAPNALKLETTSFTVAAWVSAYAFGTSSISYYIVGRSILPQSSGWRLGTDPNDVWSIKLFDTAQGLSTLTTQQNQPKNTWTHVAAVFTQGSSMELYVNGAPTSNGTFASIVPDPSATVRIGCRGDNNGFFHGSIDEVRIYNRVVSPGDLSELASRIP